MSQSKILADAVFWASKNERKEDLRDLVKEHKMVDMNGLSSSDGFVWEISRLRLLAWEMSLEIIG